MIKVSIMKKWFDKINKEFALSLPDLPIEIDILGKYKGGFGFSFEDKPIIISQEVDISTAIDILLHEMIHAWKYFKNGHLEYLRNHEENGGHDHEFWNKYWLIRRKLNSELV